MQLYIIILILLKLNLNLAFNHLDRSNLAQIWYCNINLSIIDLSNKNISSIDSATFKDLTGFRYLLLQYNKFRDQYF